MQILAHRQQLVFVNHGTFIPGTKNKPGHYEGGGGDPVAVSPKPGIQTVPDWIRDTPTFKLAEKSGYVVELNRVSPEPEVKSAADVKPEPVTGLSGAVKKPK